MKYTRFDTQFCEIVVAGDDSGLTHVHLNTASGKRDFNIPAIWIRDDNLFCDARAQILAYCSGDLKQFDLPVNPEGTDFQLKVWKELTHIAYGELRSYRDIAESIGNSKASRAVGMANSRNPIPLIIPCHRVIGSDGSLTGYAHGVEIKKQLILFEKEHSVMKSDN